MEYSTDRPINSIEEDKLGRGLFAQQLGKAIYSYRGEDSLVVGLYGNWGTGKTSILNMAIHELESISNEESGKPIIVKFNPWLYSSQANLISQFFNCLQMAINRDINNGLRNKVGKALADYSIVFESAVVVSPQYAFLASLLKDIATLWGKKLQKASDLESAKEKLEKVLHDEHLKIVVVIDDIDRLTNMQIKDIFQLVKQVGNLPNIIYVLSMDREVVQRALEDVHNCEGSEYLDKIVQIPFEIPVLNKIKIQKIFYEEFQDAIQEVSSDIQWEQDYLSFIFTHCIEPYLATLRDVNRIINTFKFRYSMLYQEISCEDLIGITVLEVIEPKLYKWISCNKDILCGGEMHALSLSVKRNKTEEYREKFVGMFNEFGIEPEKAIKCLAALFPVFSDDTGEHYLYYSEHKSNIRGEMRIAQPERFDLYFKFNLEDVHIPRYIINRCIYELDFEDLMKTIEKINDGGKILFFLHEVQAMLDKVPYSRIGMFAIVLLRVQYKFIGNEEYGLYIDSPYHLSSFCTCNLIRRLNTMDERFNVYSEAINNAGKFSMGAIAYAINLIEMAYGRLQSSCEEKTEQIISEEQLQKLESEFIDKIKELSVKEKLIEAEDFNMCFYLWSCLDLDSATLYIGRGFAEDIFKLKFVCRMSNKWYGSGGTGWTYDSSNYKEYISDEDIYSLIREKVKIYINELTEIELIKLASFVMNYQNNRVEKYSVQEAKKMVDEWRKA